MLNYVSIHEDTKEVNSLSKELTDSESKVLIR